MKNLSKPKLINLSSFGFTMIEMIVVLGILILVSGILLIHYRTGEAQYELRQSVNEFVSKIRESQMLALSGVNQEDEKIYGYGIYSKDEHSYVIFYNLNESSGEIYTAGESIDLETISLPSNISLSPIDVSIFFVPPDPITYINGSNNPDINQNFILSEKGFSQTITIYQSGRIETD